MAKSRIGSLPPTAFRIEAKLLSMPYQLHQMSLFLAILLLSSFSILPQLLPPPDSTYVPVTLDFSSPLDTPCSSMPLHWHMLFLMLVMPLPFLCSGRHCWSLEAQFTWNFHCEVFLIPRLGYLNRFMCFSLSCSIYLLYWNVWHFSMDFQASYLSHYPLLCLAHSR